LRWREGRARWQRLGGSVEVKIGVQHAPRELLVEVRQNADEIQQAVEAALQSDDGVLSLTDERGRRVLVPAERLAYVEIGEPEARRVGFGAM
jgi:uncharacterized protein DUF3107